MDVYLVGGAVRDSLLGIRVDDRDWVVVGAKPQQMLDAGYQQVGRDFPVFLHPKSHEEYALARIERKTGPGHTGFVCDASAEVTIEQDLLRRDLTINAIAQADDGSFIDPYGGQQDVLARKLRHVSAAFSEDPLRILRVARFAAKLAVFEFSVADETMLLMRQMVDAGELQDLTAERVWKEMEKALMSEQPQIFFQVLRDCGALHVIVPELDALWGVPQPEVHHPEIDTGVHVMMALTYSASQGHSLDSRLAVLLHDLGKGTTPEDEWPRHIAHEGRSKKLVQQVSKRLRLPNDAANLASKVAELHTHCHRALSLKPATLLKLLTALDVFRRPELLDSFIDACCADARGRLGFEDSAYPQGAYLQEAQRLCNTVVAAPFVEQGLQGPAIGEAIRRQRLSLLTQLKQQQGTQ